MSHCTHVIPTRRNAQLLQVVLAVSLTTAVFFLPACGSKGGDNNNAGPPAPPPLIIGSEDNRAASATVGEAGGTVSATASDGTTYALAIPPGALVGQETITIVPVTAVGNLPLRGGLVAAVRFAPDGLELFKPATLTIELPQPPATTGLVGFGFQGSGEDFHLDLVDVQGSRLIFSVTHFSGAGTGIALTGDIQEILAQPPNDPEFRAINEIVDLFAQGETNLNFYKFELDEWFDARPSLVPSTLNFGVKQGLKEIGILGKNPFDGTDDVNEVLLRRALRGYVSWLRMIDLVSKRLGIDIFTFNSGGTLQGSNNSVVPFAQLDLKEAIKRANQRCSGEFAQGRVDTALARVDTAVLWQAVAETLGLATEGADLGLTFVLSNLCVKVEFTDVTFPASIQPGQTATLSFRAPVVPASYTRPVAVTIAASGVAAPVPGGHTNASAHFSVPVQVGGIGSGALVLDVNACLDEPAFPRLAKVCGRTQIARGLDTTPPTVLSNSPANGATGVLINTAPSVTFSEAMDPTSMAGTVFTLADSTNGGTVAGIVTVSANGFTATLTPSSNLAPSTRFTATITIGAKDLSGNGLVANFTWSFTTGTGSGTAITLLSFGGVPANAIRLGAGLQFQQSECCQARLGSPAQAGGVMLQLGSSDPTKVLLSPVNLPVPAGQTLVDFRVQALGTAFPLPATVSITASAPGYATATMPVQVEHPVYSITGLSPNLTAGAVDAFQVTLGVPTVGNGRLDGFPQEIRTGAQAVKVFLNNSFQTSDNMQRGFVGGQLETIPGTDPPLFVLTVQIVPGQHSSPGTVAAGGVAFNPQSIGSALVSVAIPGTVPPFVGTSESTVFVEVGP
jgi:hypothetical protein